MPAPLAKFATPTLTGAPVFESRHTSRATSEGALIRALGRGLPDRLIKTRGR